MKVSINRKELVNALKIAATVIDKRARIDVLRCVKLATQGETALTITGSNVDACVSTKIDATQIFTGSVCVDAALLAKIVKSNKLAEVEIAVENSRLIVDSATLPTITGDEFPVAPKVSMELAKFETFLMRAPELSGMVERVSYAQSDDDSRHYLNGTFFTYVTHDARLLRLVATDGHRLALTDEHADWLPQARTCVLPVGVDGVIVPRIAMHAIAAIVAKRNHNDLAQVAIDREVMRIDCGASSVTTRCIDGQFPDYAQVIPQASNCHATFNRDAMIVALERVTACVDKRAGVRFAFGAGRVSLFAENPTLGSMAAAVDADVTRVGEYSGDLVCGFNPRYLLDALRVCGDDVHMGLSDDLSPATIRSSGVEGLAVVMPMRV